MNGLHKVALIGLAVGVNIGDYLPAPKRRKLLSVEELEEAQRAKEAAEERRQKRRQKRVRGSNLNPDMLK